AEGTWVQEAITATEVARVTAMLAADTSAREAAAAWDSATSPQLMETPLPQFRDRKHIIWRH
ncbi:MAG: hypothetical protein P8104_12605, partial [Gammaproteobacteria bacterium]